MPWIEADFKDQVVWAEVDAAGAPIVQSGRRNIRYNDKPGAKVYSAGAAGVKDRGGPARELAESVAASKPASRGSGFGKAGTRTDAQTQAAAADAKERIAALPVGTILAFTDGACTGNPGPAGSGAVVKFADRTVERYRSLGEATNNIAELTAIGIALSVLEEEKIPADAGVAVFTDSSYARGVLTQGWKAKANVGLIGALKRALSARPGVTLHWVAGHAGVPENERADALARRGVEGRNG